MCVWGWSVNNYGIRRLLNVTFDAVPLVFFFSKSAIIERQLLSRWKIFFNGGFLTRSLKRLVLRSLYSRNEARKIPKIIFPQLSQRDFSFSELSGTKLMRISRTSYNASIASRTSLYRRL